MITETQAIERAEVTFVKAGFQPSDYDVTVTVEPSAAAAWMVWFDKKGPFPIPGGKHLVKVNRETGETRFMPGE